MIDLTPLDVRKKKEDFKRSVRGYDPLQVDAFLELAADRLEQLVREHTSLSDKLESLERQLQSYQERERALNEALLAAQELREEARSQSERDAAVRLREAETHAEAILLDADQAIRHSQRRLEDLRLRRSQFLKSLRMMLERFEDHLELENGRLEAEPEDLGDLIERLQTDLVEAAPAADGPAEAPAAETGRVALDPVEPPPAAGGPRPDATEAALNGEAPSAPAVPDAEVARRAETAPRPDDTAAVSAADASPSVAPTSITPADAGGSGTASS